MNQKDLMTLQILPELSDQAAYELYDLLERLLMASEERYRHQIRRYLKSRQPEESQNLDLWGDDLDV
jgi:hypothetical protein